jgi:hypothetical protein
MLLLFTCLHPFTSMMSNLLAQLPRVWYKESDSAAVGSLTPSLILGLRLRLCTIQMTATGYQSLASMTDEAEHEVVRSCNEGSLHYIRCDICGF